MDSTPPFLFVSVALRRDKQSVIPGRILYYHLVPSAKTIRFLLLAGWDEMTKWSETPSPSRACVGLLSSH